MHQAFRLFPYPQTAVSMHRPTMELERLVISKGINFEADPCLAWQAGNVVIQRDSGDNAKPVKERYDNKIDGMVALVMALGRHLILETEKKTKTEFAPRVRRLTIP